ncbi:galactose-specific lectin nattectin-like [Mya arenaria]|uniref:galactose-specific lectin nattectin-like n=1 Tax=Mya arenaria TaxID=6604 RepID=UPI0022E43B3F|nr:galactose-specific lectin nattectin-like [Mya arenaria]
MTWADAELHCEEQGGTLAAITNQEESSSIFAWLANEGVVTGFVWIGGNDHAVEGTWEWSTAEEFAFEEMSKTSEPNGSTGENCLAIYMNRAGWADLVYKSPTVQSAAKRRNVLDVSNDDLCHPEQQI